MLSITKSLSINATSKLETGEMLATMHCTIGANGNFSKNISVNNPDLYDANIDIAHSDEDEFTDYCREQEEMFRKAEVSE